jgi:hypothetical protein
MAFRPRRQGGFPIVERTEEAVPSHLEIRSFRGERTRAEFGRLVGVTALTVYRWELPPGAREQRRPRGRVLERLRDWIREHDTGTGPSGPVSPGAEELRAEEEQAALAPAARALAEGRLHEAESELVGRLDGGLRTAAGRALASALLARVQLLVRHDTRSALGMLLGVGPALEQLPVRVRLQHHLSAGFLYGHPDAALFNPGKAEHHAALAEPLLAEATPDDRFFHWYVRFTTAVALYDVALLGRAMETFASVRELPSAALGRCLALEAAAGSTLRLHDIGDAVRGTEAFAAAAGAIEAPLQQVRALVWRAEIAVEEAAPPQRILDTLERAEELQQQARISPGIHAMLLARNKGEVLFRLGRLREAEASLRTAERTGRALSYTPVRIHTTLARMFHLEGRYDELRVLGEEAGRSTDVQQEITRTAGELVLRLCDLRAGAASAGSAGAVEAHLAELRRLGLWPVAHRHLALHALAVGAAHAGLEDTGRLLAVAERAVERAPSPTAAAMLRRHRATLLARSGRLGEARQALEAAHATLELAEDAPELALAGWALASVDALAEEPGAAERRVEAEAALARLGLKAPPPLRVDAGAGVQRGPSTRTEAAGPGPERLVVPVQRLATRGVGAPFIQEELLNVIAELLPGRAVRLEELDSSGAATGLGERRELAAPAAWFELGDGAGRRLRLGVSGGVSGQERASLHVLAAAASLALEVAGLRGFRATLAGPGAAEPDPQERGPLAEFVAVSPSTRRLKAELARLSGSRGTIIVTGESGSGKEIVARAIHALSRRADRPYVTFNSAALPRELFEGQLFGYRRGAFTGATSDHPGVIRAADGGTLFLDEIGELPLEVQPKLLRFLENGEILPLGERSPIQVDVRVIAATHRDLLRLVRAGTFREDLYYRLQVIPVHVTPLRERPEDVVALARHFLRRFTPAGKETPRLGADAEAMLAGHAWPGNVRELRNVIERSLAFEPLPPVLTAADVRL